MRNRFKPVVTTTRRGRPGTSSTNANSEGTVSSNSPAVNTQLEESTPKANEEEKSSESLKSNTSTKQGDADSAARKTLSASSTPAMGTQRRSRIKPAVTSVARSRPNTANKGKPAEARCSSGVTSSKEDNLSVSQGHSCNKDDPLSKRLVLDEQNGQGAVDSVSTVLPSDNIFKSPSLKERNQQQALSTRSSAVATPSLTNIEQRSQPVAEEAVIRPSQVQNKNTNSDSAVTQPTDSGATPSLLRRKRVLPNLGSAARRRRSSVSKENVDKNPDLPETRQEEVEGSHKDLGHINEQSAVECGGSSRNKRLRTLSEGEKNTDHAMPPVAVSDIHDKEDDDDEEDNKKKGLKRKRGGRPHKLKEPSDPSHMTMQHLIYFNPKTNPMTSSLAGRKKKADEKNKSKKRKDKIPIIHNPKPAESKEPSVAEDETDGAAVAPRVKLAADGSIILDEESLLIPKSSEKTLNDSDIVYEDADEVNFGAYLKHRRVERWTLEETQTFYKALSQVGTDFSLMGPLFPSRKRRELKAKFKREEKQHRSLVEKALRLRNPIDVELFTPKVDGEEIDDDVTITDKTSSSHSTQQL
ncbi:Transcription factor TFIIIB component B [Desmophyllum pertusum]|uniref:Transcription factor TFIIIB component B n=1 Tax=Desmophyllum pertusum TaxID=174260 RepID=A0A9X0A5Y3_9CNID|nr:Transcription factor TFIIIB component B [Desmophyllum pertusum]